MIVRVVMIKRLKRKPIMRVLILLSFLMSLPLSAKVILTSHKTAGLERPENSMAGFRHSLTLPVQAIEIDLHITADKKIVLSHDPVFDNENCFAKDSDRKVVIAQTHSSEILGLNCTNHKVHDTYKVPLFSEILDAFIASGRSDIELNIEVKVLDKLIENAPRYETLDTASFHYPHQEVADLVLDEIRKKKLASNILLSTFSKELLLIFKKEMRADEEFRLGLLYKGVYAPLRLGLIAWIKKLSCYDNCWWPNWKSDRAWMIKNQIDVFIPNWPQIDNFLFRKGFVKWFVDKQRPFEVYPWTLNTQKNWEDVHKMRLDGVITDRPSAYLNFLKNK